VGMVRDEVEAFCVVGRSQGCIESVKLDDFGSFE